MADVPAEYDSAILQAVNRIAERFQPDKIIHEAVREGKVLYERAA